ncbi:antitoxin protein of toxin-antitoxin system [Amycolatopsis sulphurea]|uniref:Antitoxin protein of toxin-antitoxin system n=1 Tax=Amycolatopsis sulphurea TaxID=76022 RepID=A0A2A9FJI0_9PSEU|nr:antitoxin [Amycolatopsis sulphurea]PFG50585.1 antitoxin protein of toxin-antitoxin system [Amycolatopsis sulphurea]
MAMIKRLTVLAGAASAVSSYVRRNPEKVNKAVGKAAHFVDEKTKGRYHTQISGAVRKVSDVTRSGR